METAMTIRSTFKTSIYLAAMLAGSWALLAAAGGDAQAGSSSRGFHRYPSPIARIPTGPFKQNTPCIKVLHFLGCGPITPPR
jgi:hypothetical protein